MSTDTKKKLAETRFFFEKLEENHFEAPFDFYLSAFISAARSVTFMMQKEYKHIEGWQAWYESKFVDSDVKKLLRKFNDMRTRTIHTQTLATKGAAVILMSEEAITEELRKFMEKNAGKKAEVTLQRLGDIDKSVTIVSNNTLTVTGEFDLIRIAEDFSNEDILQPCKRYLALLEAWVTECEGLWEIDN